MKRLLPLMWCLALYTGANSQMIFTAGDFKLNVNGDTNEYYRLDLNQVPTLQFGADMTWDFSAIPVVGDRTTQYISGSSPDFPTANLKKAGTVNFLFNDFPTTDYFTYDSTGLYNNGATNPKYTLPLGSVTGNPNDSISLLDIPKVLSVPYRIAYFPMAYNDSITEVSYENYQFSITAGAFGLNNFIARQQRKKTYETKINSWGKVVLKDPQTSVVDTFEALLMYQTVTSIDSFFDGNNNPLPATLLNPLGGFSQGSVSSAVHYQFFVKNVKYFSVYLFKSNGEFKEFLIHKDVFQSATPVNTKVALEEENVTHRIFPNPIQNGQFQLEIDKNNSENWHFELFNIMGQRLEYQTIRDNTSSIALKNGITSGSYFYAIRNEKGSIMARGKLILQ